VRVNEPAQNVKHRQTLYSTVAYHALTIVKALADLQKIIRQPSILVIIFVRWTCAGQHVGEVLWSHTWGLEAAFVPKVIKGLANVQYWLFTSSHCPFVNCWTSWGSNGLPRGLKLLNGD
jgi:hypothetical protein